MNPRPASPRCPSNRVNSNIGHSLPLDAALIDLVYYFRFDFESKTNEWNEARYAAYVTFPLTPDATNPIVAMVDLGEAAPIDVFVDVVSQRMSARQYAAKNLSVALQRLSELVYAPLARHLTNVSHLIVCPDGQLSRLPFEMLLVSKPGEPPRYLVEEKTISYVGNGREVARLSQPSAKMKTNAPVVMGNPDFDLDLSSRGSRREEALTNAELRVRNAERSQSGGNDRPHPGPLPQERVKESPPVGATGRLAAFDATNDRSLLTPAATRALSRSYRGIKFAPLPGAEKEATNVAKLLGGDCVLRLGKEARSRS